TIFEANETLTFTVASGTGYNPAGSPATGTITNDDTAPVFTIDSPTVAEGDNGDTPSLTFTVTLTGATALSSSVAYAITGGSAVSGTDFTPLASGTLTFDPGAGPQTKTIAISLIGNQKLQSDRTIEVTLSSPSNATVSSTNGVGTGTIDDD